MEVILLGGPFHGELHEIPVETSILYMQEADQEDETHIVDEIPPELQDSLHLYILEYTSPWGTKIFGYRSSGVVH